MQGAAVYGMMYYYHFFKNELPSSQHVMSFVINRRHEAIDGSNTHKGQEGPLRSSDLAPFT